MKEKIDEFIEKWACTESFTHANAILHERNLLRSDLYALIEGLMPTDEEMLQMVAGHIPWLIVSARRGKKKYVNPFTSGHAFSEVIRILSENLSRELRTRILESLKTE